MPTPTPTHRVEPASLPALRLDPAVPADAVAIPGAGAQRLLAAYYEDERRKANELAVLDADRKLSEAETSGLYDQSNGVMAKKGKDAFSYAPEAVKKFKETADSISEELANDDQRVAFQRHAVARMQSFQMRSMAHASAERSQYALDVTNNYLKNEHDAAVLAGGSWNPANPESEAASSTRIRTSVNNQVASLVQFSRDEGKSPEWLKAQVSSHLANLHGAVIDRMLANGNDQLAAAYFSKNKGEILDGKVLTALEKSMQEGTFRGEAVRKTDAIMAGSEDWKARMADAKSIDDPKLRDEVSSRLMVEMQRESAIQNKETHDLYLQATNILDKRGTISAIPPNMWVKLTREMREGLRSYEKHMREGSEPSNDPDTWLKFMDMRPADLAKMSPGELKATFMTRLDKSHWDRVSSTWGAARDAAANPKMVEPKLSNMESDARIIRNSYSRFIKKPEYKDWSTDEKAQFMDYEDAASRAVQQFEVEKLKGQRRTTDEEKQKIVGDILARKVFIERSLWPDKKNVPAAFVTPEEKDKAYTPIDQIPPAELKDVVNLARSYMVVPPTLTDDQVVSKLKPRIEKAYAQMLLGHGIGEIKKTLTGAVR